MAAQRLRSIAARDRIRRPRRRSTRIPRRQHHPVIWSHLWSPARSTKELGARLSESSEHTDARPAAPTAYVARRCSAECHANCSIETYAPSIAGTPWGTPMNAICVILATDGGNLLTRPGLLRQDPWHHHRTTLSSAGSATNAKHNTTVSAADAGPAMNAFVFAHNAGAPCAANVRVSADETLGTLRLPGLCLPALFHRSAARASSSAPPLASCAWHGSRSGHLRRLPLHRSGQHKTGQHDTRR